MKSLRLVLLPVALWLAWGTVLTTQEAAAQVATYTDLYNFSCTPVDFLAGTSTGTCNPVQPGILAQGTDGNFYGMACDYFTPCNYASIFKMTPSGQITLLYKFNGITAGNPGLSGLTLGPDGNFYGVTPYGGAIGCGTVFQATPSGVVNTLHEFAGGSDGCNPVAPPVLGDNGYLYGTASNYAYKVSTSGIFSVLPNTLPGETYSPLLLASDGNFYGTAHTGNAALGITSGTAVFQLTPAGTVTQLYAFPANSTTPYFPAGYSNAAWASVVEGSDGYLYGTNEFGGDGNYYDGQGLVGDCDTYSIFCGTVYQISKSFSLSWAHTFDGLEGSAPYAGLIAASDGNLYGAASYGSDNWGTLFKIDHAGNLTVLYKFEAYSNNCGTNEFNCGIEPFSQPLQATTGLIYGMALDGGSFNHSAGTPGSGVFYRLDAELPPFIKTIQPAGKVGDVIGILGQGFRGASGVYFNGVAATFSVVSDTYLTATVPPGASVGLVTVTFANSPTLATNRNLRILASGGIPTLATTTSVVSSSNPSVSGQIITLTATLTTQDGGNASGTVTFYDGTSVLGSADVASNFASLSTGNLAVGSHSITARYGGDSNYLSSTSEALTQVVNAVVTTPALTLSATSLTFITQNVGTTSGAQSLTVTSAGTANLVISSIFASGDFTQTNDCPIGGAGLAPNSSCTITVVFAPSAQGTRNGAIAIADNSSSGSHAISLVGAGDPASNPPQPTFTWNLSAASGPPSRTGHGMAYDSTRNKVVLFGGVDKQGNFLNDVWEFDTASETWTNVTPSSGPMPLPRALFGMAYDPVRARMLIYGGVISIQYSNVGTAGDTWEWDGATHTWTPTSAGTIQYVGLWGAQLAFDPNLQKVILFGGQPYWVFPENGSTYAWSGTDWTLVSSSGPAGRVLPAMATDPARSQVILFGGHSSTLLDGNWTFVKLGDTWTWNGSNWTQVATQGPSPSPRNAPVAAYDSARGVSVLFGGYDGGFSNETWEWNGMAWSSRSSIASPSPRWTAMAYDSSQSKIVAFGGDATDAPPYYAAGYFPFSTAGALGDTNLFSTFINHAPIANPGGPYVAVVASTVQFDGSQSNDPDAASGDHISYAWDFGDGSTGVGVTPTHIYAFAGSYTVTLTVTDSFGATASSVAAVNVYGDQVVAAMTVAPNPAAPFQGIRFDGSGSAQLNPLKSIVSYAWDFGDGTTGSGVSVTHSYTHFGIYTAVLTVTDNSTPPKTSSTSKTISVILGNQPPIAIPGGPYMARLGQPVQFDGSQSLDPNAASGDLIASYSWTFGDGSSGSGPTPTHTYAALGSYSVTLTVADSFNATGSAATTVNIVAPAPVLISITISPSNPVVLAGSTLQLAAIGNYSDGSTADVTSAVSWSSAQPLVATAGAQGLMSGVATGIDRITATVGSISASTNLTVNFATSGNLNVGRSLHTATQLNNGKVLVVGGVDQLGNLIATAELYDPSTGEFTPTGSLAMPREYHTATLLNNGKVLVVGGCGVLCGVLFSRAELYDPATETFTPTGDLDIARDIHTATLLNNGKVLIAGGYGGGGVGILASTELYDPSTGRFSPSGDLITAREWHDATALNDGKVLVTGGYQGGIIASAELYDPETGTFTSTGSLNIGRDVHSSTLLNNGQVLIAGGWNGGSAILTSAEIYDPVTGTFVTTGSLNTPRQLHTATLLNNGKVLISAGSDPINDLYFASAELYDPIAGTFSLTGNLNAARVQHTATLLGSGRVLTIGGVNSGGTIANSELYIPDTLELPNLVSISVTPANLAMNSGTWQQFTATGSFSDGSAQVLQSVSWTSSNPAFATVTNDVTNRGVAFALAAGVTTISACDGSVCGSTSLTVRVPKVSLSTAALIFGNQLLGSASAARTVILSNTGDGTLSINKITLGGANPADFALDKTCGATLAPGASCTLVVVFSPVAVGTRLASISVEDNASDSPQSVSLTGVGQAGTSTVLTASQNPALVNVAITFTATVVAPDGSIAAGSVIFKQGSTTLGTIALSGAQATYTTTYTTAGTRSITAIYSGDSYHLGSTSASLKEVISSPPVATKAVVVTSGSPSFVGQAVTFAATVSSTYGTIPDGESVTFLDGTASMGTGLTLGGVASFTTSALSVKTHTIKATYSGDSNFKSSSGTVQQIVGKYPSAVSLVSNLNPSNYGQAVTLTAAVSSSGSSTPSGTVAFKNGTASLGTATLDVNGVATLTKTNLSVGILSITATYNGDTQTATSTSPALTQTVAQAQVTLTLTSAPNPSPFGKSVKLTATLTSNGALPTGSVTFRNGTTVLHTSNIANGIATFSTTTLPKGSNQITADYTGSVNYSSASGSVTQVVQ